MAPAQVCQRFHALSPARTLSKRFRSFMLTDYLDNDRIGRRPDFLVSTIAQYEACPSASLRNHYLMSTLHLFLPSVYLWFIRSAPNRNVLCLGLYKKITKFVPFSGSLFPFALAGIMALSGQIFFVAATPLSKNQK